MPRCGWCGRTRPVPGAGTGLSPLDDELELLPGALTPWLQASLARLGSWMPFAHAARELGWLSRAPGGGLVSESAAGRLTEAAGAAYVAEQTAAVEALERRPTPEPPGPAVLQVSADGAMISLVGGQWAEAKTVAIGTVVREADGEARAREPSYFSRRADHAAFRRLALVEAHRRGVGTAGTVVAVQDGADWLQRFVDFHRRDAVRVLDFPHAVEYLTRAGHAALGVGMAATDASRAWLAEQAHALKHDVLALRTVVCADRWDEAWPRIGARLRAADRSRRQQRHRRAVARRAARDAARLAAAPAVDAAVPALPTPRPRPTPPKTILDGRPTSVHPWNRRFLPHRPAPSAEN